MTLRVLYFANLRELLGLEQEQLELSRETATLADLAAALIARHAELRDQLTTVRFAVNEEFCQLDARLQSGDVVALIPPVTGG